jgi:hypothetical protein
MAAAVQLLGQHDGLPAVAFGFGHGIVAALQRAQAAQEVDRERVAFADLPAQLGERIPQDPDRFLRIRVCSARGGGLWLLTQRE